MSTPFTPATPDAITQQAQRATANLPRLPGAYWLIVESFDPYGATTRPDVDTAVADLIAAAADGRRAVLWAHACAGDHKPVRLATNASPEEPTTAPAPAPVAWGLFSAAAE